MSVPKNLAILLWSGDSFGGAERRFARLAAHLASHNPNTNVTIYCPEAALSPLNKIGVDKSKLKVFQLGVAPSTGLVGKIKKLIEVLKLPQIIKKAKHDHFFIASNPGLISFILTRFSSVLPKTSIALVDLTYAEHSFWLDRFFVRHTLDKIDAADCLSEGVLNGFLGSVNAQDRNKIRLAPCSFTDYSKVEESSERDIDIVLLGRFTPFKGHELIEKISEKIIPYELHICGSGPLMPNVPSARIYKSINPFAVLSRAKISLSLQQFGNYPSQVVLESMACGCAIIATDTGETRKFLDESCAILIPYDAAALIAAIELLLSNPKKCYDLGQAAKLKVLSEHTIERYADYFMQEIVS
jgi:glycosyltransferase involved in cell wall biosynthesis